MAREPRRGPIPLPRGWRRVGRVVGPLLYALTLVFVAYLTVSLDLRPPGASARAFDHSYPPNPTAVERPKVTGKPPVVMRQRTLTWRRLPRFAALAAALPRGTLRHERRGGWLLTQPIAIGRSASLRVHGGRLDLAPGSFLLVARGGSVELTDVTITGLGPAPSPTAPGRRGFISAQEGGRLVLRHDRIARLGHPGVHSYGIAFWAPAKGSAVVDSTITGNYFGVYMTHAIGVRIAGNHVIHSAVYGLDPHTVSSHLTIVGNTIVRSGLHGIILADRVSASIVKGNTIVDPNDHGIMLFDRSNHNLV